MRHKTDGARHASRSPRNRILTLLIAAVVVGGTACAGSDSSTGPSKKDPTGYYSLMQVDGAAVPKEIYHGPYFDAEAQRFYNQLVATATGGSYELTPDGRYELIVDFRFVADGVPTEGWLAEEGDYTAKGDRIDFESDDGESYSLQLRNGTLDMPYSNWLRKDGTVNHYTFQR